jgi:hypothetical protein
MTTCEPSRPQDAAGEYWDALNQGVPRPQVPDLDPSLASIIDRVRTLDDARSPDSDFVTRLEQQIMGSSATTWFDLSAAQTTLTGSANGQREGLRMPLTLSRVDRPGRHWMASLATAALVLLTLIAGYVAFGGVLRPRQQDDMLAAISAIDGTPAPGVTAEEELLAVALAAEALPRGGDVILGLLHYTIPPATEGAWPPAQPATGCPEAGCPGVELAYVLEGSVTVTAASPLQVVRAAGRGEAQPIPADTALTLGPGDATLRPNGTAADYANAGATPVQVVLGYLAPGGILTYQFPPDWDLHDDDSFSGGQLAEVSGPATLRLRRAVLAADAVFAAPPGAVAQVGIAVSDPPALGTQSDGALVNAGDEATTVYALALESSELRNATPAASS